MSDTTTPQQVDTMEAGRELDLRIWLNVLGNKIPDAITHSFGDYDMRSEMPEEQYIGILLRSGYVPNYSTNIAAAWEVVDALKDKCGWFVLNYRQWHGDWHCAFFPPVPPHNTDLIAPTAPLAICRAALKAALAAKGGQDE